MDSRMTNFSRRGFLAMLPLGAVSRYLKIPDKKFVYTGTMTGRFSCRQSNLTEIRRHIARATALPEDVLFGDQQLRKRQRLAYHYGMSAKQFRELIAKTS